MAAALASEYPEVGSGYPFRERGSCWWSAQPKISKKTKWSGRMKISLKCFRFRWLRWRCEQSAHRTQLDCHQWANSEQIFPEWNALGQTLILTIRSMPKSRPSIKSSGNTHFHFDILIAYGIWMNQRHRFGWVIIFRHTLLKEGTSIHDLNAKIPVLINKNMLPQIAQTARTRVLGRKIQGRRKHVCPRWANARCSPEKKVL